MQSRTEFSALACRRRIPSSPRPSCSSSGTSLLAASAVSPPQPANPASAQASPTAINPLLLLPPTTCCSLPIFCVRPDDHEVTGSQLPFDGADGYQPLGRESRLDPDVPGRTLLPLHLHPGPPVRRHRQRRHRYGQYLPFGRLHADRLHH